MVRSALRTAEQNWALRISRSAGSSGRYFGKFNKFIIFSSLFDHAFDLGGRVEKGVADAAWAGC